MRDTVPVCDPVPLPVPVCVGLCVGVPLSLLVGVKLPLPVPVPVAVDDAVLDTLGVPVRVPVPAPVADGVLAADRVTLGVSVGSVGLGVRRNTHCDRVAVYDGVTAADIVFELLTLAASVRVEECVAEAVTLAVTLAVPVPVTDAVTLSVGVLLPLLVSVPVAVPDDVDVYDAVAVALLLYEIEIDREADPVFVFEPVSLPVLVTVCECVTVLDGVPDEVALAASAGCHSPPPAVIQHISTSVHPR